VKSGAKGLIKAELLEFEGWPRARAARRLRFIREYVLVPRGKGVGKRFRVRPWQREIVKGAFGRGVRTALVSLPRANGKTALAAALAVAELFVGPQSAQVLVVASDQRQAGIARNMARRMIELNPELASRAHIFADRIEVPQNDSVMLSMPADPSALHGWDPSLLIVDELHTVTPEVWEAVTSVTGKRPESLTLAISTPATTADSVMWRLVEHGRQGDDPAFFLREFAAPDGCDVWDRQAWAAANPALGDFLAEDGMAAACRTLREPVFRQLRLGQWVKGASAWLPFGAWDSCADPGRAVAAGARVVLAFDGSASGDSTALVAATVEPAPHIWPVAIWENPRDPQWRVPRGEVADTVAACFERWDVAELAADPWGWRTELEDWAKQFGAARVTEWNTAYAKRMAPATDRFYSAVLNHGLTHDGDETLAAHMAHTHAKSTALGDLVQKDKRNSPRKIDAAVAAIVALDRAAWHAGHKKKHRAVGF